MSMTCRKSHAGFTSYPEIRPAAVRHKGLPPFPSPLPAPARPPRGGPAQVVEKALVIREKKEKYVAREKEALLLCRHPMVVRLHSTFQVPARPGFDRPV